MRRQITLLLVGMACALVGVGLASGQAPLPPGGLGAVRKAPLNPLGLLQDPAVKKELKLTDDRVRTVDKDVWKMLETILDPAQYKRLKQTYFQQLDYNVFTDADVQNTLQLDDLQKAAIQKILANCEKDLAVLAKIEPPLDPKDLKNRYDLIRCDARDSCIDVLTDVQKQVWEQMLGYDWPRQDFKDYSLPLPKDNGADKKNGKKSS